MVYHAIAPGIVSVLVARVKENIARYFMVAESPREREENFRGLFL